MTKREKSKGPHIVREEPKPTEVAQDVAVGESLAPVDAEPPKFGPAWLGEPRAVIDYHEAEAAAREMRAPGASVKCTTCGNPVAPGATCVVDGQVAPK